MLDVRAEWNGDMLWIKSDAGALQVSRDGDRMIVMSAAVKPSFRSEGVGTELYAMAFKEACRLGLPLVSDAMRSPYIEAFWRKQARKRRAVCDQKGRGQFYSGPYRERYATLYTECAKQFPFSPSKAEDCAQALFKAVTATLPKPKKDADGYFWPCYRWKLKSSHCGGALTGLNLSNLCYGDRARSGLNRREKLMAAKKRAAKAGPKCKLVPMKTGKKRKMCWNAKGKLTKTPKKK